VNHSARPSARFISGHEDRETLKRSAEATKTLARHSKRSAEANQDPRETTPSEVRRQTKTPRETHHAKCGGKPRPCAEANQDPCAEANQDPCAEANKTKPPITSET